MYVCVVDMVSFDPSARWDLLDTLDIPPAIYPSVGYLRREASGRRVVVESVVLLPHRLKLQG